MRERSTWVVRWLILLSIAYAQLASAQSGGAPRDEAKRQASAHFVRGAELFQEGLYRAALIELQRAYEIVPDYRVLYNIGQTHLSLGEFVEAKRAFEGFLAQGGGAIEARRRAEIEGQLGQIDLRIATVVIEVDRGGAEIAVNGVAVGRSPLSGGISVNVGRHHIEARAADGARAGVEVDVAGGDRRSVALALAPAQPAIVAVPPPRPAAPAPKPPEAGLSRRTKSAIGVLSGAGALAIAGGITALLSRSVHDDYQRELRRRPGEPDDIDDARDRLSRFALSADVLFGAAIAAGVTSAVLFLTAHSDGDESIEARVNVGLTPRGVVAEGRF